MLLLVPQMSDNRKCQARASALLPDASALALIRSQNQLCVVITCSGFRHRYTCGLPPNTAPQPSALARDLAELSQRSVSGAEAAGRQPSPDGTPRTAPLQLEHWRLLEGGEALPVCRDSVRL